MFRLKEAGLHHRAEAIPTLFAPAAELMLEAAKPLPLGAAVLCVEPAAGILFRGAACSRAFQSARLFAAEFEQPQNGALTTNMVRADPLHLPLATGRFHAVLANLLLGDLDLDTAYLQEMFRLLLPGGQLIVSVLLRGTLEEFFDVTQEVCESQGLADAHAILVDETSGQYDEAGLHDALVEAGLSDIEIGVENRALPFENGQDFLENPLVEATFVPDWLRSMADPRVKANTCQAVTKAIDTYFSGLGFTAKLVTAVASGRKL